MKSARTVCIALLTLTTAVFAQTPATHGIDLTSIDTSVKPGDNFYLFANGKWVERTTIPPDRASVGRFQELADRADKQVMSIIEGRGEIQCTRQRRPPHRRPLPLLHG